MIFDFLILAFGALKRLKCAISMLCRLVSSSYSNTQDSWPLMTSCQNGDNFQSIPKSQDTFPSWYPSGRAKGFWNHLCTDFSHLQFISQNAMNGGMSEIQLILLTINRWPDKIPDSVNIFIVSWTWRLSTAWFIFHRYSSFWKCPKSPKNLCYWQKTVSVSLLNFCKRFHYTVPKSQAKPDSTLLLEIDVTHFQNALEKMVSLKIGTENQMTSKFKLVLKGVSHVPPSPTFPVLPYRTLHCQSYYLIYIPCCISTDVHSSLWFNNDWVREILNSTSNWLKECNASLEEVYSYFCIFSHNHFVWSCTSLSIILWNFWHNYKNLLSLYTIALGAQIVPLKFCLTISTQNIPAVKFV